MTTDYIKELCEKFSYEELDQKLRNDPPFLDEIISHLPLEAQKELAMMTIHRYIQQGVDKATHQIAKNLLLEGEDILDKRFISKVTELSIYQLEQIEEEHIN